MLAFSGSGYGDLPASEPVQVQGTPSKDAPRRRRHPDHPNRFFNHAHATDAPLARRSQHGRIGRQSDRRRHPARLALHRRRHLLPPTSSISRKPPPPSSPAPPPSSPVTFTAVPAGSGLRIGVERDRDGILDYDETRDLVPSVAGIQNPFDPASNDSTGDDGSLEPDGVPDGENDFDNDGESNAAELAAGTNPVDNLVTAPDLDLSIAWNNNQTAIVLTFTTEPQATYQVLYSDDLVTWTPSPTGTLNAPGTSLTWTDPGQPATPSPPAETTRRYYTVSRTE